MSNILWSVAQSRNVARLQTADCGLRRHKHNTTVFAPLLGRSNLKWATREQDQDTTNPRSGQTSQPLLLLCDRRLVIPGDYRSCRSSHCDCDPRWVAPLRLARVPLWNHSYTLRTTVVEHSLPFDLYIHIYCLGFPSFDFICHLVKVSTYTT